MCVTQVSVEKICLVKLVTHFSVVHISRNCKSTNISPCTSLIRRNTICTDYFLRVNRACIIAHNRDYVKLDDSSEFLNTFAIRSASGVK